MNLADLTALMTVFFSISGGAVGSMSSGAPWWLCCISGVAGLILGVAFAYLAHRISHLLLEYDGSEFGGNASTVGYSVLPAVVLCTAVFVSIKLTVWSMTQLGYTSSIAMGIT